MIGGKNFSSSTTAASTPYNNTTSGLSATNIQDAIDALSAGGATIVKTQLTATSTVTTSSATFSVISGMTTTPIAGTYLIQYSGSMAITSGVNGSAEIAIFQNGTVVTHTTRTMSLTVALALGLIGTAAVAPSGSDTTAIVTLNGSETIDVRFRSVSGDPFRCTSRSMQIIKIG